MVCVSFPSDPITVAHLIGTQLANSKEYVKLRARVAWELNQNHHLKRPWFVCFIWVHDDVSIGITVPVLSGLEPEHVQRRVSSGIVRWPRNPSRMCNWLYWNEISTLIVLYFEHYKNFSALASNDKVSAHTSECSCTHIISVNGVRAWQFQCWNSYSARWV